MSLFSATSELPEYKLDTDLATHYEPISKHALKEVIAQEILKLYPEITEITTEWLEGKFNEGSNIEQLMYREWVLLLFVEKIDKKSKRRILAPAGIIGGI